MASDELEPGQPDLVSDDRAGLFGRAKHPPLSGSIPEESLYTDHKAGDPQSLTPPAERDPAIERRSGSPVKGTFIQRMRAGVFKFSDLFADVAASARHSRSSKGMRGG